MKTTETQMTEYLGDLDGIEMSVRLHHSLFLLPEEQYHPDDSHMVDDKSSAGKLTDGTKEEAKVP